MSRFARKVDGNHADIRDGLRRNGYAVIDLHDKGGGVPDLAAISPEPPHTLVLLEVKAAKGKEQANQREWHAQWPGPVYVVRSLAEALACMEMHGGVV